MTETRNTEGFVTEAAAGADLNLEQEAQRLAEENGAAAMAQAGSAGAGPNGTLKLNPKKLAWTLVIMGQQLTGVDLYSYQLEPCYRILYSLLAHDGAEITMLFSRQSGKTEAVAFCIIIICVFFPLLAKYFPQLDHYKGGVKVGLFAPQLDQVETAYSRIMDRMRTDKVAELLADSDINERLLSKVNFKLKNGSFVKAQSGAKQSKIESKTYHVVFIDESQEMDTKKVRKSIIPMTASTFGTIVRLGTPNQVKGDFYSTIQHNKNKDRKERHTKEDRLHFEYDYKAVIRSRREQYDKDGREFHLLYEKSVERDKLSMGSKSEEFRMSYALEWLFDIGMFITDLAYEKQVLDKRKGFPELKSASHVVAGLDIASARANTVLTLGLCEHKPEQEYGELPHKLVADWVELGGSYEEQYPILEDYLIANNVAVLYADYTGVGRAVTDRLMYNLGGHIEIVPYTFTTVSKSDMWKAWEEDIVAGRFKVPGSRVVVETKEYKHFEEQMLNLQRWWHGKYMVCEKTSGYKDDYCDSAALMVLAGNHVFNPNKFEVSQHNILLDRNGTRYDEYSY